MSEQVDRTACGHPETRPAWLRRKRLELREARLMVRKWTKLMESLEGVIAKHE